eukprot:Sspe_Gene.110680::Locus_91747_Transcript_1_1_Confidence_1.000_Length_1288::g.110680::m.110680
MFPAKLLAVAVVSASVSSLFTAIALGGGERPCPTCPTCATCLPCSNSAVSFPTSSSSEKPPLPTIESLALKYGTDKSKFDHKYTDLYGPLFDAMRWDVHNITEIGVAAGQSLHMWNEYFPCASIFGVSLPNGPQNEQALRSTSNLGRVHMVFFDFSKMEGKTSPLEDESMDVVIEDAGLHDVPLQEALLPNAFRLVRPGGIYIMEDVGGKIDGIPYLTAPHLLKSTTRDILEGHDAFFVDTTIGHKAWEQFLRVSGKKWASSRRDHNSRLLVIRKRTTPVPPVSVHLGSVAMRSDKALVPRDVDYSKHCQA